MALLEDACLSDLEAAEFAVKKCIKREGKGSSDGGLGHPTIVLQLATSLRMLQIVSECSC